MNVWSSNDTVVTLWPRILVSWGGWVEVRGQVELGVWRPGTAGPSSSTRRPGKELRCWGRLGARWGSDHSTEHTHLQNTDTHERAHTPGTHTHEHACGMGGAWPTLCPEDSSHGAQEAGLRTGYGEHLDTRLHTVHWVDRQPEQRPAHSSTHQ